jgi:uncharacterized membrane protein (UPF0127 family)
MRAFRDAGLRLALALALAGGLAACGPAPDVPRPGEVAVTIRGHRVLAEVADSEAKKRLGLGGRDGLAPGRGMLFPYPRADRYAFWMKGMRFDIDIVWIRGDQVVFVTEGARHPLGPVEDDASLPQFAPPEPADRVLEVNAGTAARFGWRPGDAVRFEPPLEPGPAGG